MKAYSTYGAAVHRNGYIPIPCYGKRPIMDGWQHTSHEGVALAQYTDAPNLGILTGTVSVVDIDCPSETITKAVVNWIKDHVPGGASAPLRYGNGFKVAVLFKADRPLGKRQSSVYLIGGARHKVEILGVGQQFIAYGIHPDTRRPYTWRHDKGPHNTPLDALPTLTTDHIEALLEHFALEIIPSTAEVVGGTRVAGDGASTETGPLANVKPPITDYTLEDARSDLDKIRDNTTHDNWIMVGQALHHQFAGSLEALDLWDTWSGTASNYGGYDTCRKRWASFHHAGATGTVTAASLIHQARAADAESAVADVFQGFGQAAERFKVEAKAGGSGPSEDRMRQVFSYLQPIDPRTIPKRRRIYGKSIQRGYVTALVSPGGVAKSTYSLHLAAAIATGRDLLGEGVHKQAPVMLVNYEDDNDELHRRMSALCLHHNLDQQDVYQHLRMVSWYGKLGYLLAHDNGSFVKETQLVPLLIEELKRNTVECLILDPFVAIHSAPENDNGRINTVMSVIKKIAHEADCAIVLVHHTAKGSGKDSEAHAQSGDAGRGASALKDAARSMITMARMSDQSMEKFGLPRDLGSRLVRIDTAKSNYAPPDDAATWFRLVGVSLGNEDYLEGETESDADHAAALEAFDLETWVESHKDDEDADPRHEAMLQILSVADDRMHLTRAAELLMPIWNCARSTAVERIRRTVFHGAGRAKTVETFHGRKTVFLDEGDAGRSVVFRILEG